MYLLVVQVHFSERRSVAFVSIPQLPLLAPDQLVINNWMKTRYGRLDWNAISKRYVWLSIMFKLADQEHRNLYLLLIRERLVDISESG